MLKTALLITALLAVTACSSTSKSTDGWAAFGEGVSAPSTISLDELLDSPADYDGQTVIVEAEVVAVCQKKGCWMTFLRDTDSVRITFKDYGFFVPMDLAGSTVRVEGVFAMREVPVDEARHYLEDEGRTEEALAITEPRLTYEIVATGVEAQTAS
jgi:hypothetical protein